MTRFCANARPTPHGSSRDQTCGRARRPQRIQTKLCLVILCLMCTRLNAEDEVLSPAEGTRLTLEQLMEARIYSVSKKPQKLGTAASAISVITEEDVRRSGANNIPDALRLAP